MKEYIFIGDEFQYYITKAENENEAILNLFDYMGGSQIFIKERFAELCEKFDKFELIRLFEREHGKIIEFGEYNGIYGKPV